MKKVPLEICNRQNGAGLLSEYEFFLHNNMWAAFHIDRIGSRKLNKRVKRLSPKYIFGHDMTPDEITTNMPPDVAEFFNESN